MRLPASADVRQSTAGVDSDSSHSVGVASDHGSGTLLTVAIVCVVLFLASVIAALSVVYNVRVKVQNIVDLAALAGGDISASGQWQDVSERACLTASAVVVGNEVDMGSCAVEGSDIRVVVHSSASFLGMSIPLTARARAGPR